MLNCVVLKLGGGALTHKQELETLNFAAVASAVRLIQDITTSSSSPSLIVVHGAGSFGHFQAADSGIARGGRQDLSPREISLGFAKVRASVTKLNNLLVHALVSAGVPAVGVSPLGPWSTRNRAVITDGCAHIEALLTKGLVPVLHGDSVLDEVLGFTVLGGDPIISCLCHVFRPRTAIFVTNVSGIFDRPPELAGARLLQRIVVNHASDSAAGGGAENGATLTPSSPWIAYDVNGAEIADIVTSTLEHDTTGGVQAKIDEAVTIVALSGGQTTVRIVKLGTKDALHACRPETMLPGWRGTELTLQRGGSSG